MQDNQVIKRIIRLMQDSLLRYSHRGRGGEKRGGVGREVMGEGRWEGRGEEGKGGGNGGDRWRGEGRVQLGGGGKGGGGGGGGGGGRRAV